MTTETVDPGTAAVQPRRVIGQLRGPFDGPTAIVMTGIHGNEPAGAHAAGRVLSRLGSTGGVPRGELVVLAGNLKALPERTRFIDHDLNRQWTPKRVAQLRAGTLVGSAEWGQQIELLDVFREIIGRARGQVHFFDMHTSSADGSPFLTVGDTLRNRAFARNLPLPLILGLEEQVDGSLLEYLNNFGFVTIGVEAGQHDSPESIDRHEAFLWLALSAMGLLRPDARAELESSRDRLTRAARGVPRVIEVRHRHAIGVGDGFRMEPGFRNFQHVRRGRLIAHDATGPIHAPEDGLLLLPLYQGKGDDGFFVARSVRGFWIQLSAVLRRLHLDSLIHLLPGVRRHPEEADVLLVNTRIARAYPLEIFHLFGFRKLRRSGNELVVSRRRYDLAPPRDRGQIYFC